ncbi:MAG: CpaF family protein [Anaerovoracaceae bacterium]
MPGKFAEKHRFYELQGHLITSVRDRINCMESELSDDDFLSIVEDVVLGDPGIMGYGHEEKRMLVNGIFNATRRELGLIQPYADDEEVSEIMVNGTESIFIEKKGRILRGERCFQSTEELEELIRRLAGKVHREINELNPIVDARLDDGSRINAVYKNVALGGPILTIRRFPRQSITMEELIENHTITREGAEFLKKAVEGGLNIFISGGTSSGKTTFLNVLSGFIPREERVIVIEDSAELQLDGVENLVRMETKSPNVQGKGEINMRQLIRTSLRMRPDRIIVGEVRGGEVHDMVQAMNTGHDGSLSTGHGNSAQGMLYRLEAMFLAASDFPLESVRNQIAEALDIIVHMGRMPDKSRKVLEIVEVLGCEDGKIGLNTIFSYGKEKGLHRTGKSLQNRIKLELKGVVLDDGL